MTTPTISVGILTLNEEAMLAACLDTLTWCDEIIICDQGSSDKTIQIAHKAGVTVIAGKDGSFNTWREQLRAAAKSEWILYIDADERVTPELAEEIKSVIQTTNYSAYTVARKNIFFGDEMAHGGWSPDRVPRLFHSSDLQGWSGSVHERPQVTGSMGELTHPLWHFTHRSVREGLQKSVSWTAIEANLLYEGGIKKVTIFTVLRKGLGELWRRLVRHQGYKDGSAGIMESLIQAINRMLVYIQVWERQQKPSISQRYNQWEEKIRNLWQTRKQ